MFRKFQVGNGTRNEKLDPTQRRALRFFFKCFHNKEMNDSCVIERTKNKRENQLRIKIKSWSGNFQRLWVPGELNQSDSDESINIKKIVLLSFQKWP